MNEGSTGEEDRWDSNQFMNEDITSHPKYSRHHTRKERKGNIGHPMDVSKEGLNGNLQSTLSQTR